MNIYDFMTNSFSYFLLSFVLLMWAIFRKNDNFFDIRSIVINHMRIFKDCKLNYIFFYGVPILLAVGTTINQNINESILTNLNVVISILISTLCASLAIISNYKETENKEISKSEYKKLLSETYNSILFEVILCITTLILSFVLLFSDIVNKKIDIYNLFNFEYNEFIKIKILSYLLYFFAYTIFLQIFIIIKRLSYIHKYR